MTEFPHTWKVATVWLLVGLLGFLGVQTWQASQARPRFEARGGVIELQRQADGHYHWAGRVNGHAVDFLVDTGATRSAVPAALARELQLEVIDTVRSQTAAGEVRGELVRADLSLHGGVQVHGARLVSLARLGAPLLGMDVLGRLALRQHGQVLSIDLNPAAAPA